MIHEFEMVFLSKFWDDGTGEARTLETGRIAFLNH